jgi:hypothetical protein
VDALASMGGANILSKNIMMFNFLLHIFSLSYILRNIKFHVFLASVIIKGFWNKKSSLFLQHNLPTTQNTESVDKYSEYKVFKKLLHCPYT